MKPTEKVFTGRSMCFAISATIKLESRPPLSIAPERDVAHQAQPDRLFELCKKSLAPVLEIAPALERGLRIAPEPPLLDRAVLDHEDAAGLELLHGGERCRGAGKNPSVRNASIAS